MVVLIATLATLAVALAAAYFAYLAVPRPVVQVAAFQMVVDVSRQQVVFQSRLKNTGPTNAYVRILSLGRPLDDSAMPEHLGEMYFPGARWHFIPPGDEFGANAAFAFASADDFLGGKQNLNAEFRFRSRAAYLGGSIFGNTVTLKYQCLTREQLQKPFRQSQYLSVCNRIT